ncbi:unnamed protein product [Bursaphelenchus xylophilus]|uniref:(pine wood nematode) hypothetical protein n=1 Tax=Bursaphelenchus xylophilus TaxID=6326 RepID=A0A1I7RQA7_BURXY|nr:unnamed protein product [Bursaphelenchus xylophilus]CAG9104283.1 unnamed protein product [Bursaphelenchus xylophilus]
MAIVTESGPLPGKLPVSKDLDFYSKSERLFEKRNENISATEAVALNDESIKFINTFTVEHTINNERRDHHRTYFDQVEGNGTKEIVVIGNSLARDLYFGVRSRMRNVYKRLTLFYISGILPFQNNTRRNTSPKDFTDFVKNMNCTIDILVTGQAYKAVTVPPDDDYIRSQMLGDLQNYYDQLAGLDVKLLVIPYAEHVIDFTIEKYNQAVLLGTQRQLNYKHTQVHSLHTEAINKVIDKIKCKNCVKIDFYNSLCDPVEDHCYVGQENGLAIYRDKAHTTIFGSIYFADALSDRLKLSGVVE